MATIIGPATITVGVRHKPLLLVAEVLYRIGATRTANRLVDHCVTVTDQDGAT